MNQVYEQNRFYRVRYTKLKDIDIEEALDETAFCSIEIAFQVYGVLPMLRGWGKQLLQLRKVRIDYAQGSVKAVERECPQEGCYWMILQFCNVENLETQLYYKTRTASKC